MLRAARGVSLPIASLPLKPSNRLSTELSVLLTLYPAREVGEHQVANILYAIREFGRFDALRLILDHRLKDELAVLRRHAHKCLVPFAEK